jgi:hypothetical protein
VHDFERGSGRRNGLPYGHCWFSALAGALEFLQGIEGFEKVAGNYGVVAKILLPMLRGHGHEGYGDGLVRVQVVGAVFDKFAGLIALGVGGDVIDSCLYAA